MKSVIKNSFLLFCMLLGNPSWVMEKGSSTEEISRKYLDFLVIKSDDSLLTMNSSAPQVPPTTDPENDAKQPLKPYNKEIADMLPNLWEHLGTNQKCLGSLDADKLLAAISDENFLKLCENFCQKIEKKLFAKLNELEIDTIDEFLSFLGAYQIIIKNYGFENFDLALFKLIKVDYPPRYKKEYCSPNNKWVTYSYANDYGVEIFKQWIDKSIWSYQNGSRLKDALDSLLGIDIYSAFYLDENYNREYETSWGNVKRAAAQALSTSKLSPNFRGQYQMRIVTLHILGIISGDSYINNYFEKRYNAFKDILEHTRYQKFSEKEIEQELKKEFYFTNKKEISNPFEQLTKNIIETTAKRVKGLSLTDPKISRPFVPPFNFGIPKQDDSNLRPSTNNFVK